MGLVLALPLALQDPLPNILRAVGGAQRKAWRRRALAAALDGALAQSAAVAAGNQRTLRSSNTCRVVVATRACRGYTHAGVKSE